MWALCRGRIQKLTNNVQDFFWLFCHLIDKFPQLDLEKWAVTAWAIWNARKKIYFESFQVQPKFIHDGAIGLLEEYQRLSAA